MSLDEKVIRAAVERLRDEILAARHRPTPRLLKAALSVVIAADPGFASLAGFCWRAAPDGGCAARFLDAQGDLYRCELPARHLGLDHEGGGNRWFACDGWDVPLPESEPPRNALAFRRAEDEERRPISCACARPGGPEARTMTRRRACAKKGDRRTACRCACHRPGARVWSDGAVVDVPADPPRGRRRPRAGAEQEQLVATPAADRGLGPQAEADELESAAMDHIDASFHLAGDALDEAADFASGFLQEAAEEARRGDLDAARLSIDAAENAIENARAAVDKLYREAGQLDAAAALDDG